MLFAIFNSLFPGNYLYHNFVLVPVFKKSTSIIFDLQLPEVFQLFWEIEEVEEISPNTAKFWGVGKFFVHCFEVRSWLICTDK